MLSVPYFKQNRYYTCGPVCLRMVLAYWGYETDEVSLSMLCGTDILGTSAKQVVTAAQRLGFESEYASEYRYSALTRILDQSIPPIIAIDAGLLYMQSKRLHAKHDIVLLEATSALVTFHDPEVGAYLTVTPTHFKDAWSQFQNEVILIWPAKQTLLQKSAN